MDVTVSGSGPVLDGRGPAIMRDFADDLGAELAREGVPIVRLELAAVLQNPTGRYQSSIHAVHYGSMHEVTDGGMVYGPWLAGSGSRNRTTRFKGYAHWRRSVQRLERRVTPLAQRFMPRLLGRLNGR